MKRALWVLVSLFVAPLAFSMGSAPPPGANDPQWEVPQIKLQKQEQPYWCWAASAQAVLSTQMSQVPSQCHIVSRVLGKDCCSNRSRCNVKGDAATALQVHGVDTSRSNPVSTDFVIQSIRENRPLILRLAVRNTYHAVVAYGIYQIQDEYYLKIFDPIFGKSNVNLKDLLGPSAIQKWVGTSYLR